ncbi:hypothetical protein FRX31_032904, partial [Thalictrum thalictroides]
SNTTLSDTGELEHKWSTKENSFEENECDYCSEDGELDIDSEVKTLAVPPNNNLRIDDVGTRTKVTKSKNMEWTEPSPLFSPISSPKTPSNLSTPSPSLHSKNDAEPLLRLCSNRITNITISTPVPGTPRFLPEACISPAGSDGQVRVRIVRICSGHLARSYLNECEEEGSQGSNSITSSGKLTPLNRPPKDFVCPITRQL